MEDPTIKQNNGNTEIPDPGSGSAGDPSPPQIIHILLIEDNPDDVRMIERALKQSPDAQQFNLTHFDNLEAGIASTREQKPDLILLDLHVKDSAGWATFENMHSAVYDVPIVISTGLEDERLALRAIHEGAQDYFSKDLISTPGFISRIVRHAIQREQDKSEVREAYQKLEATLEELRKAQLSLVQSEKLKTIGRLAAGIAHEVKNPLAIIRMGLDFVNQKFPDENPTLKPIVEDLRDAVNRADKIVNDLMQYGAPHALHLKEANINEVIENAVRLLQYAIKSSHISYKEDLDPDIPPVKIDSEKIVQVIVNCILNATQAMENGGGLTVRSYSCPLRAFVPEADEEAVAVAVDIVDTGPGIHKDDQAKLFEPFFTTKGKDKGTGLGLSVSRMILGIHHGGMTLNNHPQGGAIARIYLPVSDEGRPAKESPAD